MRKQRRKPGGGGRSESADLKHGETDARGEGWEGRAGTGGAEEEPLERVLGSRGARTGCPAEAERSGGRRRGRPRWQAESEGREGRGGDPQGQRSPSVRARLAARRGGQGAWSRRPSGDGGAQQREKRSAEPGQRAAARNGAAGAWRGPRSPARSGRFSPAGFVAPGPVSLPSRRRGPGLSRPPEGSAM